MISSSASLGNSSPYPIVQSASLCQLKYPVKERLLQLIIHKSNESRLYLLAFGSHCPNYFNISTLHYWPSLLVLRLGIMSIKYFPVFDTHRECCSLFQCFIELFYQKIGIFLNNVKKLLNGVEILRQCGLSIWCTKRPILILIDVHSLQMVAAEKTGKLIYLHT